jgi:site-specific DNA recombinase
MGTRVAIYVRISKDRTGEALGVQRQEEDCRALAARLGWTVLDVYPDNDISAYSGKARPAYRRMLADIEAGRVDAIICWDTSRLYRQLYDLLGLIDLVEAHKLQIETCRAGKIDLSTPTGRAAAKISATINQLYSEENSARIKRKKKELAQRGLMPGGGNRPFGFEGTGADKVPRHRALMEQETIKDGVTYILTGWTCIGLARKWNKAGIKTSKGGEWTGKRVRDLLINPRIAGRTKYGDELFKAQWAEIVPFDKWQQVCDKLTDGARTTTRGRNNHKYLLSGIMVCGRCGTRISGVQKRGRANYLCALSMGGCGLTRQAKDVENLLLEAIFQAVESPVWDERVRQADNDDAGVQQLLERRTEVVGLLDRLEDKLARELISEAAGKRNRIELETELDDINRQLSRLQDNSVVPTVPRNLRNVWADLSFDRQRSIVQVVLRATGRRLELHPQARAWPFDADSVKLVPLA